jgi:hypothetical protein
MHKYLLIERDREAYIKGKKLGDIFEEIVSKDREKKTRRVWRKALWENKSINERLLEIQSGANLASLNCQKKRSQVSIQFAARGHCKEQVVNLLGKVAKPSSSSQLGRNSYASHVA